MSTTATQHEVHIPRSKVAVKPTLLCKGYVDQVLDMEEPKEDSMYLSIPISVKAYKGGHGARTRIYFRPEWFAEDFEADFSGYEGQETPKGKDMAKSLAGCCKMNVFGTYYIDEKGRAKGTLSQLQGFAGTWNAFVDLLVATRQAFGAYTAENPAWGDTEEGQKAAGVVIQRAIKKFFVEDNGASAFGYVLKQKKDQDGILTEDYELSQVEYLSVELEKRWERRAKNSTAKEPVKIAYERD